MAGSALHSSPWRTCGNRRNCCGRCGREPRYTSEHDGRRHSGSRRENSAIASLAGADQEIRKQKGETLMSLTPDSPKIALLFGGTFDHSRRSATQRGEKPRI